jgi:Uma2 family endonuclease
MTTVTDTLPWGHPLTAEEYLALDTPDDGQRYELLDGVLVVTPSPLVQHQRVVLALSTALSIACPPDFEVFGSPLDVRLSERTVVEPDVLVVRREDATGHRLTGVPLLVVEVLSDSTRGHDLILKRERYAEAGVPSYWVVEPVTAELAVLELRPDGYDELGRHLLRDAVVPVTRPFEVLLDVRSRV